MNNIDFKKILYSLGALILVILLFFFYQIIGPLAICIYIIKCTFEEYFKSEKTTKRNIATYAIVIGCIAALMLYYVLIFTTGGFGQGVE